MKARKSAKIGVAITRAAAIITMSATAAAVAAAAPEAELRLPAGAGASAPAPAALVISGSDASFNVTELADGLVARGVAVFKTKDADPGATFRDRAKDVVAAIETLRALPEIDAKRIALVGMGEGSWIAVLADSASQHVASFVRISGPEVPPSARSLYLQFRDMKAARFSDATVNAFGRLHGRLLTFLARRTDRPAILAAIDSTISTREAKRAHRKGWLREWIAFARDKKLAPIAALEVAPWVRDFDFDPGPLTCASPTPTLAIYGGADSTLLVPESANRLRDSLDFCAGTVGDVWVVEGGDHAIRVAGAPADNYFDRVAAWIRNHPPPATDSPR